MRACILALCGAVLLASQSRLVLAAPTEIVYASQAGARLNSNLMTGGGSDDTKALQKVLNHGADGRAAELVVDGPALVSGLDVYAGTTITCTTGGGFFSKEPLIESHPA